MDQLCCLLRNLVPSALQEKKKNTALHTTPNIRIRFTHNCRRPTCGRMGQGMKENKPRRDSRRTVEEMKSARVPVCLSQS
jgi:hypothetical protein